MIAANRLHEEGILFHYEEILVAGDDEFPDFFMMITVAEKYAWEHFGAMDNEKYHSRQRVKIMDYLDHQWFPPTCRPMSRSTCMIWRAMSKDAGQDSNGLPPVSKIC